MRRRNRPPRRVPERNLEPPEPEHEHSHHRIEHRPDGSDFDGFGHIEAERVEGEPLVVVRDSVTCAREGCHATERRYYLFTTETLSDDEWSTLEVASGVGSIGEYVHEHAERVDVDAIEVDGIRIDAEDTITEEVKGVCHGRPERPDPEPYGL